MKNMNDFQATFTGKEVSANSNNTSVNKVVFDKESVYNSLLQLSSKMNFWGEGFNPDEEWCL